MVDGLGKKTASSTTDASSRRVDAILVTMVDLGVSRAVLTEATTKHIPVFGMDNGWTPGVIVDFTINNWQMSAEYTCGWVVGHQRPLPSLPRSGRPNALFATVAGFVLAARLGSGQPSAGQNYLLDGLATVFIGMIMLRSGTATTRGTFFGALLIGVINNGLNLVGLDSFVQDIVKRIIIVLAVPVISLTTKLWIPSIVQGRTSWPPATSSPAFRPDRAEPTRSRRCCAASSSQAARKMVVCSTTFAAMPMIPIGS